MDLALNNLQRLICHKTQPTKPEYVNPRAEEIIRIMSLLQSSIDLRKNYGNKEIFHKESNFICIIIVQIVER